jgi:hypothetical protein
MAATTRDDEDAQRLHGGVCGAGEENACSESEKRKEEFHGVTNWGADSSLEGTVCRGENCEVKRETVMQAVY